MPRRVPIVALDAPVDLLYGEIRADLEAAGQSIGPNDLLIAAHARALDVPPVTAKVDALARVPDLAIENWLA